MGALSALGCVAAVPLCVAAGFWMCASEDSSRIYTETSTFHDAVIICVFSMFDYDILV